jgi:hypothetical protein
MLQCDLYWSVLLGLRGGHPYRRPAYDPLRVPSFSTELAGGTAPGPYADVSGGHYEGRTACRKPANFAVALH